MLEGLPNPLDILYAQVADDEFDAQLVAYDSATGFYAWYEQIGDSTGNLTTVPGAIVGVAGGRYGEVAGINGGTRTWQPAKAYNGEAIGSLPKYVRLRKRSLHDSYGPIYEIINPPSQVIHLVDRTGYLNGTAFLVPGGTAELSPGIGFTQVGLYDLAGSLEVTMTAGVTAGQAHVDAYFVPQSADLTVYPNYDSTFPITMATGHMAALASLFSRTPFRQIVEVTSIPGAGFAELRIRVVMTGVSGSSASVNFVAGSPRLFALVLRAGSFT